MENTSQVSEKFTSTLKETKGGVPQGLVLGPVLFLLYACKLPIYIQRGRTTLFPDDMNTQIEATNAMFFILYMNHNCYVCLMMYMNCIS